MIFALIFNQIKNFNPRPPWGGRQTPLGFQNLVGIFQSTPSVGRATVAQWVDDSVLLFQSTPSVGRATATQIYRCLDINISIHALRGEGDDIHAARRISGQDYFNPRPPWGGRRYDEDEVNRMIDISIHALRGEGDDLDSFFGGVSVVISIHALRGEGDGSALAFSAQIEHFNPRPPWGGRQALIICITKQRNNFNPRPPWGGRLTNLFINAIILLFQSTPSVGRATIIDSFFICLKIFQSTPSVGRATRYRKIIKAHISISIHALRGEGDLFGDSVIFADPNFNPRPPWGGRQHGDNGGADLSEISIHALRGEGDRQHILYRRCLLYFNPRPPWGGRLRERDSGSPLH